MKAGEVVSLQRMKAWWAYSEIRSPRFTAIYQRNPRVPPVYAKITTCAFEDLSAFEVDALVEIFENRLIPYIPADRKERLATAEQYPADSL